MPKVGVHKATWLCPLCFAAKLKKEGSHFCTCVGTLKAMHLAGEQRRAEAAHEEEVR